MNRTQLQRHSPLISLFVAIATLPVMFSSTTQAQNWSTIEQDIITEQNRVRQNPRSYIPLLEAHLASMDANGGIPNGCGPNCTLQTREGQAAVREAIAFLRNQPALNPVELSSSVAQAAKVHAIDQAAGATGHIGSDGRDPGQRFRQQGIQALGWGENIAYGSPTAQAVVRDLIIDDGVLSRGHRTNIFNPDWTHSGAGCGDHVAYRNVCVIGYIESRGAQQNGDRSEIMPIPEGNQLTVIHNGTVELRSLQVGNTNILGRSLAPEQSRNIVLDRDQCRADLRIQLAGNYAPLDWSGVRLCGSVLSINEQNEFVLQYQRRQ
ncbi:MAG: CAP domain-containing protein [Cyanothece sp. SIO2G6]|nr:CAP domain-containing protein [Cyanothece sp. SIO2G6]